MASQRWRAAMEYYVGLDVSLKQTSICVVNQVGSVVREGVVDSDPEAIAAFVRSKAPGAVRVGLETGPTTTWLWSELKQLGLPVICIDARHARAVLKMQINKSDRNNAAGIARIMQTGWFKEVRVKDLDSHSVRALLASRALLVKIKRDLENQIRGPLKNFGLVIGRATQCLRRTSRGVDRGSSRFGGCSQAAARSAQRRRAAGQRPRPQGYEVGCAVVP